MTESEISRLWLWSKNTRSEFSGSVSLAAVHQSHPQTIGELHYFSEGNEALRLPLNGV